MRLLDRRRFLTISAGLGLMAALPAPLAARGTGPVAPMTEWSGIALGARARILIAHPEADRITAAATAEIARLEGVFSLYRGDSALSELNRTGQLEAPPFELLECLALCAEAHAATGGLFDPTIQPLWALYAETVGRGLTPAPADLAAARRLTGWSQVRFDTERVTLGQGQALTLNGVAQGVIADRVAGLLAAEGLTGILVDTGEMRALGPQPDGTPWPVRLAAGGEVALQDRSLASSSALGTTFDPAGEVGHILNPLTGLPATPRWRLVSITAPQAGVADALSTAACLMPDAATIRTAVARFPGARLEHLA